MKYKYAQLTNLFMDVKERYQTVIHWYYIPVSGEFGGPEFFGGIVYVFNKDRFILLATYKDMMAYNGGWSAYQVYCHYNHVIENDAMDIYNYRNNRLIIDKALKNG